MIHLRVAQCWSLTAVNLDYVDEVDDVENLVRGVE